VINSYAHTMYNVDSKHEQFSILSKTAVCTMCSRRYSVQNDKVIATTVMPSLPWLYPQGEEKFRKRCSNTVVMGSTATAMLQPWVSKPELTPRESMRLVWQITRKTLKTQNIL